MIRLFLTISSFIIFNTLNYTIVQVSTMSIEQIFHNYNDEKNAMISFTTPEDKSYDDFYDELENWLPVSSSMNIIFFGAASSFVRLDVETILHLISKTKKQYIPISKVLLAWDLATDGKTAAFLQGRELYAFGTLLNVVPEEDLYYVNFGDPTVLNFFSKYAVNLQTRKYGVLVSAFKRYYGTAWYTNGSYINDLGYLLCGFPAADLKMITPEVFKEISVTTFSKLSKCNKEQTQVLYNVAVDREAYGSPYKWSSHEIQKIGNLLTYMPTEQISSLHLEAVTGITESVMLQMHQSKLEHFTLQQIFRMNPRARRIFILRVTLKNSIDIDNIGGRSAKNPVYSSVILIVVGLIISNFIICI